MTKTNKVKKNKVIELNFNSMKNYKDPFNEVDLDFKFIKPNGKNIKVPAFWAGGNNWKVRFSSNLIGKHRFESKCSNESDEGLHNKTGEIVITEYSGNNKLYRHGPLKVSDDSRHFEHEDGKPFFWLADTWWYAFTKRFKWPEIFKILLEDRLRKGFSVIHVIAGLYPDYGDDFDKFSVSEMGHAWDKEYKSINPLFFDMADIKVLYLIEKGIVPCIFGMWDFFYLG
jgi:hypothetical protein